MDLKKNVLLFDINTYIFDCPHCNGVVLVAKTEVNCQIFRHGIIKSNDQQVNPHASKGECEMILSENLVYGCCNPFKLILDSDRIPIFAEKCDWI